MRNRISLKDLDWSKPLEQLAEKTDRNKDYLKFIGTHFGYILDSTELRQNRVSDKEFIKMFETFMAINPAYAEEWLELRMMRMNA